MTFPGDTAGGGITDDTGTGLQIYWLLATGTDYTGTTSTSWDNYANGGFANGQAVNIMSSTDNYFYLTGVQFEVGSQATAFEHRSFAEELALCQRYYYIFADARDSGSTGQLANGFAYHNGQAEATIHYPVMRTAPSLVQATGTNYYGAYNNGGNATWNSFSWYQPSPRVGLLYQGSTSGLTQGQGYSCLLYTSPSPRDRTRSRMPSSA